MSPAQVRARPDPSLVCAGVLDGRDIGVLNTNLRAAGVSDKSEAKP